MSNTYRKNPEGKTYKESLQQKLKPLQLLNNLQMELHKLDRFTILENKSTLEDLDGEYVLFSSVLNLFTSKK